MALNNTTALPHATVDMEIPMKSSAPPPPEYKAATGGANQGHGHVRIEATMRALLCVTSLVGVIVMVTSKQTEMIPISPTMAVPTDAKFNHSASYIYYVAALSVAFLYGIITGASSLLALKKMNGGSSGKQQFHMVILDSLMFGIVASALGATLGVSYIGMNGNSHSRWHEICHTYDSYCNHLKGSVAMSLMSSIELLLLIWLAFYVLSKKIGGSQKY